MLDASDQAGVSTHYLLYDTAYYEAPDEQAGKVVNVATAEGTSPDPDEPDVPVTPGTVETPTGEYEVPLGIGASMQCGDCFE